MADLKQLVVVTDSSNPQPPAPVVDTYPLTSLKIGVDEIDRLKVTRKVAAEFYEQQNSYIDSLVELLQPAMSKAETDAADGQVRVMVDRAIQMSLALTLLLVTMKTFAGFWSGSMAVTASAIDSVFDILSQGTLWMTTRAMAKLNWLKFPVGKSRMAPLAIMVFAVVMGLAGVQLMIESFSRLRDGLSTTPEIKMDAITLALMGSVTTFQLLAWQYCKRVVRFAIVRGASVHVGAAEALVHDHINDVFINVIGGIPAIFAYYFSSRVWFFDPLGGVLLALYIAYRWAVTCKEQFDLLVGAAADPAWLSRLTYLAANHHALIQHVDSVYAYRIGSRHWVEVHIVLSPDLLLRTAHDIGETLEQRIEALPDVEMCFVHLDYEWAHKPEHGREDRKSVV